MNSIINIKFNRAGFTLVELIIAISIMSILFGIAAMNFQTMRKTREIESQTRDLLTVLVEARNNAFMQKIEHGVILQEKSYIMKAYTSVAGGEVKRASYPFKITQRGAALPSPDGIQIRFDSSGFLSSETGTVGVYGTTLNVDIEDTSTSLNCLVIHSARVNMGKWNATSTACEFK